MTKRKLGTRRRCQDTPITDFFDNEVEIGDLFFFGNPCVVGYVIKKRQTSIMLETGARRGRSTTMNCQDPTKGICLNKIPEDI